MTGERVNSDKTASASGARHNERSTIAFPYLDLDTAVEVARAIYEAAGLGECELDQLAAQMGQTVSGAFRQKTATARMYGVVDKSSRSGLRLTDLGREIVQAESEPAARVDAFLNIPLYKQIFENYRGHLLPPAKALEREMQSLGVAQKQTDKARQVFDRSARQAGFFAHGEDRLVQPRHDRPQTRPLEPAASESERTTSSRGEGSSGDGSGKPLKYQLIDLLEEGGMREEEQKAVWVLINYLARRKQPKNIPNREAPDAATSSASDDGQAGANKLLD